MAAGAIKDKISGTWPPIHTEVGPAPALLAIQVFLLQQQQQQQQQQQPTAMFPCFFSCSPHFDLADEKQKSWSAFLFPSLLLLLLFHFIEPISRAAFECDRGEDDQLCVKCRSEQWRSRPFVVYRVYRVFFISKPSLPYPSPTKPFWGGVYLVLPSFFGKFNFISLDCLRMTRPSFRRSVYLVLPGFSIQFFSCKVNSNRVYLVLPSFSIQLFLV